MVIALGGNAVIGRGEAGTFEEQYRNVQRISRVIADLVGEGHRIAVTHGNGPQVGATLIRHEAAGKVVPPQPLDACGAETQGFVGYMIQRALNNELERRDLRIPVATVVTLVLLDGDDPAFKDPTKPIGPYHSFEEAERMRAEQRGIMVVEDSGTGYRRVVPSPDPKEIIESRVIGGLFDAGYMVVAPGGGEIPVVRVDGELMGVEAVVDKDLAAECLASGIGADTLSILTDVDFAYLHYRDAGQTPIRSTCSAEMERYLEEGHFEAGSMRLKVLAAIRFVSRGGDMCIISSLEEGRKAIKEETGTIIHP